MRKIIEYISILWKKIGTNRVNKKMIFEQDYKWLVCFVEELGFSNVSCSNDGLDQEFINQDKDQKILFSIGLSHQRRTWDVIKFQVISNKRETNELIKKWSIWRSSLNNDEFKKEIKIASEAFFRVSVSFGSEEPLLLYDGSKLEGLYVVPKRAILVNSKDIGDLVIKAFNLGSLNLSDVRTLKRQTGIWEGIDDNGRPTGGIMLKDEFVGCAYVD